MADVDNTTDLSSLSDDEILAIDIDSQVPVDDVDTNDDEVISNDNNIDGTDNSEDASEHDNTDEVASTDDEPDEEADVEADDESNGSDTVINYEEQYKELFKPFKANGKEMTVTSIEDARTLMQKGAGFDKKMQIVAPHIKAIHLLEKHNLLSEEKLNYLIDLESKNPKAIANLVKESGIDLLDLNMSEDAEYTPNTYTVDDTEIALEEVFKEIKGTPSFSKTLDVVGNKWDDSSKAAIAEDPSIIKAINSHMESGVYDAVMEKVETERMFGRLQGMSDLEAYKAAGDLLYAQPANVENTPKASNANNDPTLRAQRKAATGNKKLPSTDKTTDIDKAVKMSDAEFEKYVEQQLLR